MKTNNLVPAATFSPFSLQHPDAWMGHLPFAAWLIKEIAPRTFVELGTHSGNSYFSFCQAVAEANLSTKCYAVDSWQGDEHAGYYGEKIFGQVNAHNQEYYAGFSRLLRMTFDDATAFFSNRSIDLLHIDGLHTYEAVKHDFETWLSKLAPGAVVLFHDTNVRERGFGVWKLWEELHRQYPLSMEFAHSHGLGVLQLADGLVEEQLSFLASSEAEQKILKNYFAALGARQAERYELGNLRNSTVERDGQLAGLNQALTERDGQIAGLNQALTECDGQIAGLNQTIAERDGQIAGLNQTIAERDGQVARLNQTIAERDGQIASILNSRSWRLTRSLRYLGNHGLKLKKLQTVIRRKLQKEPFPVLLKKMLRVLYREGFSGIKVRIRQQHHFLTQIYASTPPVFSSSRMNSCETTAIVRDPNGHYALDPMSRGYTYIEPQRPSDLESQIASMCSAPLFSLVIPVYNTSPELLEAALKSVQTQWYPHWQLILANDASPSQETRAALARIDHPQIKILHLPSNQGISGATNVGLDVAEGDFIVFMDHDDELTVDCLYELALCIKRENPDFIYSDEDKLSVAGYYTEPHFKPDWSPDTMMSTMYTCHVSCVRRSLLERVGGLRSEFDGCQDWDFVLRVAEQTTRISHIPKILYHWRIIPASTASDIAAKPYVLKASQRVRSDALARRGLSGKVEPVTQVHGYFRVAYDLKSEPLISIIIPTRDNEPVLRRCVDSILRHTRYRRFEIVILDNGSAVPSAVAYLNELGEKDGITVIRHDAPFNFSELNNIGVRTAVGELLLFLNDDTEVLEEDWLERLGGFAQLPHIGAVGAKLLYPGGKLVQHAGVLNLENGPGHALLNQHRYNPGYSMRNLLEYNWLVVTGACLMVERSKYEMIGGLAECLPVAYNDVDFCMRLRDAGYYNVVVQAVSLIHHESASRGIDADDPIKMARLKQELAHLYERNPRYFQYDPFHNPNLHPNGINFEVPA